MVRRNRHRAPERVLVGPGNNTLICEACTARAAAIFANETGNAPRGNDLRATLANLDLDATTTSVEHVTVITTGTGDGRHSQLFASGRGRRSVGEGPSRASA